MKGKFSTTLTFVPGARPGPIFAGSNRNTSMTKVESLISFRWLKNNLSLHLVTRDWSPTDSGLHVLPSDDWNLFTKAVWDGYMKAHVVGPTYAPWAFREPGVRFWAVKLLSAPFSALSGMTELSYAAEHQLQWRQPRSTLRPPIPYPQTALLTLRLLARSVWRWDRASSGAESRARYRQRSLECLDQNPYHRTGWKLSRLLITRSTSWLSGLASSVWALPGSSCSTRTCLSLWSTGLSPVLAPPVLVKSSPALVLSALEAITVLRWSERVRIY